MKDYMTSFQRLKNIENKNSLSLIFKNILYVISIFLLFLLIFY